MAKIGDVGGYRVFFWGVTSSSPGFFLGVTGLSFGLVLGFFVALDVGCALVLGFGLALLALRVLPAARFLPLSTKRMVTGCDSVSGSSV